MAKSPTPQSDPVEIAARIGAALNEAGLDYAIGGALALGYWSEPRGTNDVDVTVYCPVDAPDECFVALRRAGGEFVDLDAMLSIRDHGFFRLTFDGMRVDVFLPTIPIYEACRLRRQSVVMEEVSVWVWQAEPLAIFKMMFFRPRDLLDVEAMLEDQKKSFDHAWVRDHLLELFDQRDPRITNWDEIVTRTRR